MELIKTLIRKIIRIFVFNKEVCYVYDGYIVMVFRMYILLMLLHVFHIGQTKKIKGWFKWYKDSEWPYLIRYNLYFEWSFKIVNVEVINFNLKIIFSKTIEKLFKDNFLTPSKFKDFPKAYSKTSFNADYENSA